MSVDTNKKHQETVESDANMLCQMKQIDGWLAVAIVLCHPKKVHDDLYIPDV